MKHLIGFCGKYEKVAVYWREGDGITIPACNVLIATNTRDRNEAVATCKRNLVNFAEV